MEEEKPQIPEIDFSGLELSKHGSERWKEVATQVFHALQSYGCFKALHEHVFTPELRAELLSSVRDELFALPLENKLNNSQEKTFGDGYSGQSPAFNAETFAITNPIPHGIPNLVSKHWPTSENPKFRELAQLFTEKVIELEKIVRCMVVEELGVKEAHAAQLAESIWYTLRFWEYGRQGALNEKVVGNKAHRDTKLLSVLWQLNDVNGLEVQSKEGHWIPAKLSSSLMVLAGNSLMAWSNGRLPAPIHHVVVSKNSNSHESIRYSVILFSSTHDDFKIEAPEELVDEQHPRLFRPFTLPELVKFAFSEEGKKTCSQLTTHFSLDA